MKFKNIFRMKAENSKDMEEARKIFNELGIKGYKGELSSSPEYYCVRLYNDSIPHFNSCNKRSFETCKNQEIPIKEFIDSKFKIKLKKLLILRKLEGGK